MKNLYDGTSLLDRSFGRILRTDATRPETIVPEILLADNKGRKTYPSLEAMVEAGWVVD